MPNVRLVRRLTLVWLLLLLPGCTTTRHIREAQDAFNAAARSENDLRAATFAGSEPVEANAAAADYRKAVALVDQELAENRGKLQADQLLGNAMMLKALSLWRLTDLDDRPADDAALRNTLNDLNQLTAGDATAVGTRDRVLIRAIPGLRDHDRGLRATTVDEARGYFVSAYKVLDRSLTVDPPPPNHPIRTYVRLAQLSTLRAYLAAVFRFQANSPERAATLQAIFDCATRSAVELKPVARSDRDLGATVERMNTALGLSSINSLPDTPPACSFII